MRQGAPSASRSERGSRSATTPAAPKGTPINAKIVWALCVVVLSGVAAVAWTVHVPAREGVVLNAGTGRGAGFCAAGKRRVGSTNSGVCIVRAGAIGHAAGGGDNISFYAFSPVGGNG